MEDLKEKIKCQKLQKVLRKKNTEIENYSFQYHD